MPDRVILAIETSNPSAGPTGAVTLASSQTVLAGPGVAVGPIDPPREGDPGVIDTELLRTGARHDDLLPAIERLFDRAGLSPRQIERVAVSIGPGGYTGVRIAVTAAAMIAQATGSRVVPVPTPRVIAWAINPACAPVAIALASKRDAAHSTLFDDPGSGNDSWPGVGRDLGLIGADDLEQLSLRTLVGDDHLPEAMRTRAGALGLQIIPPVLSAAGVLALARTIAAVDPADARPFYPREPEAVTRWRELHPGPDTP